MALFLLSAGVEVGLDDAMADAVRRLIADPSSLRPGLDVDLRKLLARHRRLDAASLAAGAMIVAGASGGSGLARHLLERWAAQDDVAFVFSGHLAAGSPAEQLVRDGRAISLRWNVHPRLAENRELLSAIGAGRVIPAFASAEKLAALRSLLPAPFDMEGDIAAIA